MVCTRTRCLSCRHNSRPSLCVQVEVEEVVEILATLALIASKEVEAVHEGDSSCSRSLLRIITNWLYAQPSILPYAILVKVIESLVIVCACEQVNVTVCKYALVTRTGCVHLALSQDSHPLVYFHLLEVLLRIHFALRPVPIPSP